MAKALKFLATAIAAFVIYILFAIPLNPEEIFLGGLVALVSSVLMIRFLPFDMSLFNPIRIYRILIYLPCLFLKMIQANLNITSIVIKPKLKIKAFIVKKKTTLATPVGKLLLTSSITLTPGALSVDVKKDQVLIHRVFAEDTCNKEIQTEILEPLEKFIREITE